MTDCHPSWHVRMQLSVLRLFQQILADAALRKQPAATEILQFAAQVTRSLFARLVPPAEPQPSTTPAEPGMVRGSPALLMQHAGMVMPSLPCTAPDCGTDRSAVPLHSNLLSIFHAPHVSSR